MLVTRYHGVWIIVPAFNEEPVVADVIADLRPVQSIRPSPCGSFNRSRTLTGSHFEFWLLGSAAMPFALPQ
jgi:hypothetical protein